MKTIFLTLFLLIQGINIAFSQVSPLLSTSWSQGCYYNDSVPSISSGPCGKAYTGCIPTAIAQLLKYHNYPTSGWGSNTHTYSSTNYYVDFSAQTYNYSSMPNAISSGNAAIAQLMYHCGVAAEAFWNGSNTISSGGIGDMKRYFKYSLTMKTVYKSSFSNTEFENLLISELDAGRPVAAIGGSHQYIIDGYQTSPSLKFHINFGWGGSYNGYYDIHNVVVSSTNYTPSFITHHIMPLIGGFETTDTVFVSYNTPMASIELSSLNNWNMVGSSSWITPSVTSGTLGYYQNTLNLTSNPNYTTRYGTVQYSNGSTTNTVVVAQSGIVPYVYASPLSNSISSGGGTFAVNITTDSTWMASTADSWLSLSASSGIGNGSINITASPNGPTARTGYVTIQRGGMSQTIEIIQGSNASFWCIPSITTGGGDGITNVTLNTINRPSVINEGYIVTSDTTSLYLDTTYTINVTFQGGVAPAVWIDWNQNGSFGDPGEDVVPPSGSWYPSFNSTKTMNFVVPSNASLGLTRMRVYGKDFGTGPVSNPCNTSDNGGDIEDYHIVVKDSRYIETDINNFSFLSNSSSQSLTVTTDSLWNLTSFPSWISASLINGGNNALVNITTTENMSFTPRTGLLTFTRGPKTANVNVYQAAMDSLIQFAVDTVFINSTGETGVLVNVFSNFTYNIQSLDSWITSSSTSASDTSSFLIDVTSNTGGIRSGQVVVGLGTFHDTLIVYQDSVETTLSVAPDTLFYSNIGGTQNITITTPATWYASTSDSWLTLSQVTGTGNQTILIECDTNISTPRQGLINITISGNSKSVIIMQSSTTTGLAENLNNSVVKVFPNPTNGVLNIEGIFNSENTRIIIRDLSGKILINQNLDGNVNIQTLSEGYYLVYIVENGVIINVRKIAKE